MRTNDETNGDDIIIAVGFFGHGTYIQAVVSKTEGGNGRVAFEPIGYDTTQCDSTHARLWRSRGREQNCHFCFLAKGKLCVPLGSNLCVNIYWS